MPRPKSTSHRPIPHASERLIQIAPKTRSLTASLFWVNQQHTPHTHTNRLDCLIGNVGTFLTASGHTASGCTSEEIHVRQLTAMYGVVTEAYPCASAITRPS